MATKPTRLQEQGCDQLADALVLITGAARLDGKAAFGARELSEVGGLLAKATTAFPLDQIVTRALERRVRAAGLRAGAVDLLTLMESELPPLQMLLLSDERLAEVVAELEAELGDV